MKKLLLALLGLAIVAIAIYTATQSETPAGIAPSGGTTSQTQPPVNDDGAASAIPIPDDAQIVTVDYVHDGDTLFVIDSSGERLKVRLIGLDTPEVGEFAECYGDEARERLRSLLPEGSTAWAVSDEQPFDRYGRSLLHLWTTEGDLVSLDLVASGHATALRIEPSDEYWQQLADAERQAEAAGRGLWGAC